MKGRPTTGLWMGMAFCAALVLAAAVLLTCGSDDRGIRRALEVTARFSFLLFWAAYAGGALTTMFGAVFQPLARRGREFGLAFASAHLVHVGLVVWLYRISAAPPVSQAAFIFFGIGLIWVYLLALLSLKRLSQALGPTSWRLLRTIGLEYIAFAFLSDFVADSFHGTVRSLVGYLPFAALGVIGTCLRLAAWARRRRAAWAPREALRL